MVHRALPSAKAYGQLCVKADWVQESLSATGFTVGGQEETFYCVLENTLFIIRNDIMCGSVQNKACQLFAEFGDLLSLSGTWKD